MDCRSISSRFESGSQLWFNRSVAVNQMISMDIRTQKTFEALFALEDIRETLRQRLPNITGPEDNVLSVKVLTKSGRYWMILKPAQALRRSGK
jgi:hypothetical protein